jgi:hypothetical protein
VLLVQKDTQLPEEQRQTRAKTCGDRAVGSAGVRRRPVLLDGLREVPACRASTSYGGSGN